MKKLLITTALCWAATGAAAELTYGSAFLNYHNLDGDGGDIDLTTFRGELEFRFDAFTFTGEAGSIDLDDGDFRYYTLGGGYQLQNGVTLGLDHVRIDLDTDDLDVTSAYALYEFGAYTLGLSAGDSSDLSDTVYSVFGAWDVSEDGVVGIDVLRVEDENLVSAYVDYDLAQYSVEADLTLFDGVDVFSIEGAYKFGNGFSVLGGLSTADFDGTAINTIEIGAAYEFVPGANVEFALARTDIDDLGDFDRVTVGVNYDFGKRTSKRRTLGNILANSASSVIGINDF